MAGIFLKISLKKNHIGLNHFLKNSGFIMLLFFISLLTVINLETSFLGNIQSDRYGYFAAVFFSIFLGFVLFSICYKRVFFAWMLLITCLFTFHTIKTNNNWLKAGEIADRLICSFMKFESNHDIYIMNLPDNYNGAYIFRCNFAECMMLNAPTFNQNKIFPIAFQNLSAEKDIISIEKSPNNKITIIAPLTDCYFMRVDEKLLNHELLEINLLKFSKQQIDLNITSDIKENLYYFDGKELKQIIPEN
jgi:hypothetical protein